MQGKDKNRTVTLPVRPDAPVVQCGKLVVASEAGRFFCSYIMAALYARVLTGNFFVFSTYRGIPGKKCGTIIVKAEELNNCRVSFLRACLELC